MWKQFPRWMPQGEVSMWNSPWAFSISEQTDFGSEEYRLDRFNLEMKVVFISVLPGLKFPRLLL